MPLTVQQCASIVRTTLGGEPPPELSALRICNEAGLAMCGLTSWRWLEGRSTTIDTVSGQNYVDLPADFAEPRRLVVADGSSRVVWVPPGRMAVLRQTNNPGTGVVSVCIGTSAADMTLGTGATPILEIDPVPDASTTGYFALLYRAGWPTLSSDAQYLPLPANGWLDLLYIAILGAVARGYLREESGSFDQRLSAIRQGVLFRNALRDDRRKQVEWGPLRGCMPEYEERDLPIRTTITGP